MMNGTGKALCVRNVKSLVSPTSRNTWNL